MAEEHLNDVEFRPVRDPSQDRTVRRPVVMPDPEPVADPTPIPPVTLMPAQPKATPMSAPTGSFAASIRAMMDDARAGIAQARTDGLAKVGEAVGKLNEAKAATAHVAGTMAQTIEDEAASVLAELGQISNSLGGE